MIDALTGGREVQRAEQPRLYNILENLCISRGITMPKLKIMESDQLNAFATGMNAKQYSITVTTGLLNRLNDAEIESVLGHELTHIRNGDVRMMVIAVIIAGVVSFFAELVFRLWFYNGFSFRSAVRSSASGGGAGVAILIAVGLLALAYLLSFVIRLALSRHARIPRRCRLSGTDQESRCHDLGAAQDRRPRRIAGRDLGGDGNVHRQSRAKVLANCSTPIRASTAGSRRWSNSPAATIPARWRCRRKRANRPRSVRHRSDAPGP